MYCYYEIIERSYGFCMLETGFGELQSAWDKANKLQEKYLDLIQEKYLDLIEDIDVLVFNTEKERVAYIRDNTK